MSEFTTISVMGVVVSFSCVRKRFTTGNRPVGMR
jgi:hypothetical protein